MGKFTSTSAGNPSDARHSGPEGAYSVHGGRDLARCPHRPGRAQPSQLAENRIAIPSGTHRAIPWRRALTKAARDPFE
eukprot:449504-Pyramimonas_sp.AAC.1